MPERLQGADCKSAGSAYVGSNPTRPTLNCPCSSAVEHSLGKGEVSGSSPDEGMNKKNLQYWSLKEFERMKIFKSTKYKRIKSEITATFLLY